jgi:hypothetical protein
MGFLYQLAIALKQGQLKLAKKSIEKQINPSDLLARQKFTEKNILHFAMAIKRSLSDTEF